MWKTFVSFVVFFILFFLGTAFYMIYYETFFLFGKNSNCSRTISQLVSLIKHCHQQKKLNFWHYFFMKAKKAFHRFYWKTNALNKKHIKVERPLTVRKKISLLVVKAICDNDLLLTKVVARWPGSTYHSRIFRNINGFVRFERMDYSLNFYKDIVQLRILLIFY